MAEKMSICVNGESQVPPGFRFHPTEEELLRYYLRKKVSAEKIDLGVIRDVDLNRLEPWDIQEKCKIGSTPQNDWYFFSHKDKKYPTGTRTNRATSVGFWKATGRDKVIYSNASRIGMRKTLVFYRGRAPNGQKSDWIMHEYRLDDTDINTLSEEGWVVCRVFKKKKNHFKSPSASSLARETCSHVFDSCDEGALEQVLEQMGREKLPSLDSPKCITMSKEYHPVEMVTESEGLFTVGTSSSSTVIGGACGGLTNWETLDRLVASQLNDPTMGYCTDLQFPTIATTTRAATYITPTVQDYTSDDIDLWNFVRSTN